MGLADYKPEHRVFPFEGGSFSVKGLSLTAFTALIRTHMPDLEAIFDLGMEAISGKTELTEDDLTRLVMAFAEEAPGLVANVIALAADEHNEAGVAAARSLPFPTQITVLMAIAEITFSEVGGIKKAWESVARLLNKTKPGMLKSLMQAP